jgi:hypothetical protein
MKLLKSFPWIVPNNANTPPLFIADSGTRFSTLTGVKWLNDDLFVVNHRSGLKMAIFNIHNKNPEPINSCNLPHLTDDIDAKKINDNTYEIAVSGCWAAHYTILQYNMKSNIIRMISTQKKVNESFVHGVTYSPAGDLWLGIHTGKDPRVVNVTKRQKWKLPPPWGTRKVIFDPANIDNAYAIAVSSNPKLTEYSDATTSVWKLNKRSGLFSFTSRFFHIKDYPDIHSDSACIHGSHLFLLDQRDNSVIKISMDTFEIMEIFKHPSIDFPHGVSINSHGDILVCNYGNSEVNLIQDV